MSEIDPDKIHSLREKLDEIKLVLQPFLVAYQYPTTNFLSSLNSRWLSIWFEGQFAKEITALYYLQLYSDYAFQMIQYLETGLRYRNQFDLPDSGPKECLSLLLKNDVNKPLLSEWFYDLMEEISNHQKEIYNALPKRQI